MNMQKYTLNKLCVCIIFISSFIYFYIIWTRGQQKMATTVTNIQYWHWMAWKTFLNFGAMYSHSRCPDRIISYIFYQFHFVIIKLTSPNFRRSFSIYRVATLQTKCAFILADKIRLFLMTWKSFVKQILVFYIVFEVNCVDF